MFSNLLKAVVGVAVETPVAMLSDFVTLGGTLSNKQQDSNETYTESSIKKIVSNIEEATK